MADPVLGYDDEELVAVVIDERNWKGIGISLVVIVTILSFIGLAIFILTPKASDEDWGRFRINLTDLIGPHLKPNHVKCSWISGSELMYLDSEGSIVIYDALQNISSLTLIPSSKISQYNVQKFILSPDRKYVLLEIDPNEINNSSNRQVNYKIYNTSSKKLIPLEETIQPFIQSKPLILQYASWTNSGNAYVFILNNDIYYCQAIDKEPIRLTQTGSKLAITNGLPNWYYKEFLGLTEAIWVSSDGNSLIYATFNDTLVDLSPINIYGNLYEGSKGSSDPISNHDSTSSQIIYQRYPKAGRAIPTVTLWLVKLSEPNRPSRKLTEPTELIGKEKYLTYVAWSSSSSPSSSPSPSSPTVTVVWTLRSQNYSLLVNCSPSSADSSSSWSCRRSNVISDSINRVKYLGSSILTRDNPSKHFIITPKPDLKIGQYHHIAVFNPQDKYFNLVGNFLTHGRYDVKKLLTYSPASQLIYFEATGIDKPAQSHLYSLSLSNGTTGLPSCITCNLTVKCGYYETTFSPTTDYYVLMCLGPRKVFTTIYSTVNHTYVWTIEDNKEFEKILMDKRLPSEMYLTLPIDNDSRRLNIKVLVPPPRRHLEVLAPDEEDSIRYPLVIESFPMVDHVLSEKFNLNWGYYLSSSKEYVYVQLELHEINPKEQTSRDYRWSKVNYNHQLAIIDLIDSLLGNIDRRKVALWGSSSSAFTALETIFQDKNGLISCSIGQSPIVDWRLMDAISAEYLFGNPNTNQYNSNYGQNNLFLKTYDLATKRFLIAHGTANEFVHIQHTMLLTKSLIKEATKGNINYQIQVYPDDDHQLSQSKLHFLLLIETYLHKCFSSVQIIEES